MEARAPTTAEYEPVANFVAVPFLLGWFFFTNYLLLNLFVGIILGRYPYSTLIAPL
jgi:hypothetical protein